MKVELCFEISQIFTIIVYSDVVKNK